MRCKVLMSERFRHRNWVLYGGVLWWDLLGDYCRNLLGYEFIRVYSEKIWGTNYYIPYYIPWTITPCLPPHQAPYKAITRRDCRVHSDKNLLSYESICIDLVCTRQRFATKFIIACLRPTIFAIIIKGYTRLLHDEISRTFLIQTYSARNLFVWILYVANRDSLQNAS